MEGCGRWASFVVLISKVIAIRLTRRTCPYSPCAGRGQVSVVLGGRDSVYGHATKTKCS